LSNGIESQFFKEGKENELVEQIKAIDPNANIIGGSIKRLEKQLEELEEKLELNDWDVTLLDGLEYKK
jgi:hypothetical protein